MVSVEKPKHRRKLNKEKIKGYTIKLYTYDLSCHQCTYVIWKRKLLLN